MKVIRSFITSIAMFSKIPVPDISAGEDDMSSSLAFFPVVGALIGICIIALNLDDHLSFIPVAVRIILTLLIPLGITGGIHTDGFMDTSDALGSYLPSERKLEIMKDPHTGSFAVISLLKAYLLYACSVTALLLNPKTNRSAVIIFGLSFVISRCLSALSSLYMKKAKTSGMLHMMTKNKKVMIAFAVAIQLAAAAAVALWLNAVHASAVIVSAVAFTVYYRYKSYKEFGGVTGDTAGWYLTVCEIICALALAATVYAA